MNSCHEIISVAVILFPKFEIHLKMKLEGSGADENSNLVSQTMSFLYTVTGGIMLSEFTDPFLAEHVESVRICPEDRDDLRIAKFEVGIYIFVM